jgi:hypothetical protein
MKEEIDIMMKYLSQLTEEEANWIQDILNWTDQQRIAFKFAKKIFDEEDEDESR